MKNKTKYLIVTLCMLVGFLLAGAAIANAETTDITEIKLTGNYQYGNVPAGILPSFNPGTTTEGASIGTGNGGWAKRTSATSMWGGFGADTPVAYNDGNTEYGFTFYVKTNSGYQLASAFKVFYNGEEVTSTVEVLKYAWGAYVTVDLGKAIGENPATHTVTFVSNGGTEIASKEVVSGLKINEPSKPTKDKYLFRGWYEDATFSTKFDFYNTPITSDMTLYAKWEAANSINEIRLAGDYQKGTVPVGTLPSFNPRTTTDSITIDNTNSYWAKRTSTTSMWGGFAGNTPVAYNDGKTYYGYTFRVVPNDGYQLDYSNLKVFYNEAEVTSTAEVSTSYSWGAYVTVDLGKANGTPVVYTITFNSNGGASVAPQDVNAGGKLTEPTPAPTKEGFTFDGWYKEATFNTKFDFNTPITDSMILYAKWTENKYTLTFGANGGSGTMAPIANLTGEYTLPANEFTAPSGKQFKGWSLTADGAIVTKVDMTENKTVYAIWEDIPVVTYTLTFNANGGSGTMAPIANLTGEYTLPANGFTAPSGKQFKGWSLTANGAIVTKVDMTENKKVYAIWEDIPVVTYTLTFDANGGTGSMTAIAGLTGEYTLPTNEFTAPSGKQFKGWSLTADGAIVTKVDMTENKTVYAIWEDIPVVTYTLTFNANGGSGTMTPIADLTGEYTLPANGFTAPSGKQFKGWSLTTDGETVTKVNMTENRTVYAIWEDIPVVTYTLTFDANGGTGTMAAKTGLTGEYTLPTNEFTAPSGKQFKGWSLTADGAIVTKVDMTENKTVYAIWEDIPVVTYTLTFDANGGTGTMAAKTGLTGEYTLPTNEFTAPSGKQFKGWSLTADGAIVTKVDMTENKTVYAIWEDIPVVTYTLTFDANGGTGTMAAKTGLTGEYTLPTNEFTAPSGKQFKGWSLTTDGTIVTKVAMTENRTVYAIWTNIGGGGGSSSGGGGGFYVPTTQKPEIKAAAGGKAELSKDGTTLTITADAGKVIDKVLLNGKDMGAVSELKGLKTGDKVEVTFKDQVTEPTKEQLDKAAKEAAGDLVLTARSAKLKNGSVKIMLKGDLKAITDAGYTVKYKFYRSTKKSAGYKAMLTKKAPTYFNTYGKKGTMYYYKARVMIYDKDGNFVAQTALKQCKYANRLWTK